MSASSSLAGSRRYRRVSRCPEPPRPAAPGLGCWVDSNSRSRCHGQPRLSVRRRLEAKRRRGVAQIHAVVCPPDREGGAYETWAGGELRRRRSGHSLASTGHAIRALAGAAGRQPVFAGTAHQIHSFERLDGAHEQGRRPTLRFCDNVQAVVHTVDKVHVRIAGWAEHDSVAFRTAESSVGRQVIDADVGLDFNDPADSYAGEVRSDQSAADQGASDLQAIAGQKHAGIYRAGEDAKRLAQGNIDTKSLGSRPDRMCMIGDTNVSRIAPAIRDWCISRS